MQMTGYDAPADFIFSTGRIERFSVKDRALLTPRHSEQCRGGQSCSEEVWIKIESFRFAFPYGPSEVIWICGVTCSEPVGQLAGRKESLRMLFEFLMACIAAAAEACFFYCPVHPFHLAVRAVSRRNCSADGKAAAALTAMIPTFVRKNADFGFCKKSPFICSGEKASFPR